MRRLVDTLRKLTTRIPESLLPILTWPLALGLHGIVGGLYAATRGSWLGRVLPARAYFEPLIGFSFRRKLAIVTDQLVAPQTRYVRREELRAWLAAAGLEEIAIMPRNGNSWRARGRRSSTAKAEDRAATWPSEPTLINYGTKA